MDLFDLEWMLDIPPGQGDYMQRRELVDYWCKIARQLGMEADVEKDLLRKLQEYVGITPPAERCPCKHGVSLQSSLDHFPHCDGVFAHRVLEGQEKKLQAKKLKLEREQDEIRRRWAKDKVDAKELSCMWRAELAVHISTEKLEQIQEAIEKQLGER